MFKNMSRDDDERIDGYVGRIAILAVVIGGTYFLVGKADSATFCKHPNEFGKTAWHHLQPIVMDAVHTVARDIVAVIVIFGLLKLSQWLFRFKRKKQLQTYEIVLSCDDMTGPFEIAKFFDAVNGMLLPRFQWLDRSLDTLMARMNNDKSKFTKPRFAKSRFAISRFTKLQI